MKYIIQDWCGNVLEDGKTFDTFEDGWDWLLGEMTDRLGLTEEDYQEYSIEPANVAMASYVDPIDPRTRLKNKP